MTAIPVVVQWAHVLSSAVWLGTFVFVYIVLYPRFEDDRAPWIASAILQPAATLSIALLAVSLATGIVRGTMLGPIDSLVIVTQTIYGLTWLAGLIGTIAILGIEFLVLRPRISRLRGGSATLTTLRVPVVVELLFAMAVIAAMALMRFGL